MRAGAGLLEALADGEVHSGRELAEACGISRAAIAKRMARFREAGWPIVAQPGVGYRLQSGSRPLVRSAIAAELAPVAERMAGLEVLDEVDSTMVRLGEAPVPDGGRALLCIAEHQSAGRGRRGRAWIAPAGGAITFSLLRGFDCAPAQLLPLSLIAGVAVAEVLQANGLADVRLKWPNDVQVAGAKLGGILVEVAGEAGGPARATLGLGLNHDLGAVSDRVDQHTTDLRAAMAEPPDRSVLAGRLMRRLLEVLQQFAEGGAAGFLARWRALDALAGQRVRVEAHAGGVEGVAEGVDADGALLLRTPQGQRRFVAGEVSLRPAS